MSGFNLIKIFSIFLYVFIPTYTFADNICSKYKFNTDVNVKDLTVYEAKIKSSDENMVGKMGYIEAHIAYSLKQLFINIPVKNGYCISLRSVDFEINTPSFEITIDKRLKPNSCAYNVILSHENDHMNSYKEVISNNIVNIKKSVSNAVNSIEPVFVSDLNNIKTVKSNILKQIENYKDIQDIQGKIKSEINEKNEEIDTRGDSFDMWNCEDFYNEMKNSFDNISID